jgi:hypothetical protein
VEPQLVQRGVVEPDPVRRPWEARRVAVDAAGRLGQVDDAGDPRVEENGRGGIAEAMPARRLPHRRAQPLDMRARLRLAEAVDEVHDQHPRLQQPDAVVVRDQPRIRVGGAVRVRPDEVGLHARYRCDARVVRRAARTA